MNKKIKNNRQAKIMGSRMVFPRAGAAVSVVAVSVAMLGASSLAVAQETAQQSEPSQAAGSSQAAPAQSVLSAIACRRGGELRAIDIITPGVIGRACDVRQTYNNGVAVKTPYHANNSTAYCTEKAAQLTANLQDAGFDCSGAENVLTLASASAEADVAPDFALEFAPVAPAEPASPTQQPVAPAQVAAGDVAPANIGPAGLEGEDVALAALSETQPSAAAEPRVRSVLGGEPTAETAAGPQADPVSVASQERSSKIVMSQTNIAPAQPFEAAQDDEASLANETVARAAVPSASAPASGLAEAGPATSGPTSLVSADKLAATDATTAPTKRSAVGRLTGADPTEAPAPQASETKILAVVTPLSASGQTPVQTPAAPAQSARQSVQVSAVDSAAITSSGANVAAVVRETPAQSAPAPLRSDEDLIRSVLGAQAAAWNEGDLDAFMKGYWKSDELRFVSGVDVTTGWSETLARYRKRYGSGAELGTLSFENLDVQMVTGDVAVVVGRFNLKREAVRDSGAFSLVMRRFDGAWRIVHDHTSADQ